MDSKRGTGIMLVGHGTRDATGTRQFFELSDRLTALLSSSIDGEPKRGSCSLFAPALLEFQNPTIGQAWRSLVDQGARHIHVAPLLLFRAGHAREDIPQEVRKCHAFTPGVSWDLSLPLSRHPEIVALLAQRVSEMMDRGLEGGDMTIGNEDAFVLVGRGSRDVCAQADTRLLGEITGYQCGFKNRRTAFYAMAEPRLPAVLDRVARGPVKRVWVQPHLLFQGRLYDAIKDQVDQARSRHPDVEFLVGDYLGPVDNVARALLSRALQSRPKTMSFVASRSMASRK